MLFFLIRIRLNSNKFSANYSVFYSCSNFYFFLGLGRTGKVQVTADDGAISEYFNFRYVPPSKINDIAPSSGQVGTRVAISGVGLRNGAPAIDTVTYLIFLCLLW